MAQVIIAALLVADLTLKLVLAALFIGSHRKKSKQKQAEKEAELFLSQLRNERRKKRNG